MVKRLVFLLFLLILILGGCTEKDIMAEQFGIRSQEVLQAEDFHCDILYGTAGHSLTLTGKTAKELYAKLVNMASAGERITSATGETGLQLYFYTGESGFLDGLAHTQAETAEDFLPFIDSATYYGCFTVFDSDVAWITEWPITSHGTAVVLESGTYADLMTLVHTQTKGEIP